VLTHGELEVVGRIGATCELDGVSTNCVYKPGSGERPLWDFPPHTLAQRETAAYAVAAALGWPIVPPTVLREGPVGAGSVQWWVGEPEEVPEPGAGLIEILPAGRVPRGWLSVLDAEGGDGRPVVLAHADDPVLRRMALFDAVTNNTDRKAGHILRHASGRVYGVDHGLTFNLDDKLRTVLWGWAGDPLGDEATGALDQLATDLLGDSPLRQELDDLLDPPEIERTARRVTMLLRRGRYPSRPHGWGAVPWPPF
jgi:uncharacterized repeat protein (TIGR03843 family)